MSNGVNGIPQPPYTITEKAADYLAKIVETMTRLELGTEWNKNLRLHRENRARSIYSSLAIEGNSLTLQEVTAVIDGRIASSKQVEIKEVKNAYEAYDSIMKLDPYKIEDFLAAHKMMTQGLVQGSGEFRRGDVGVFKGDIPIHIGARPEFVPHLIMDLLTWAKNSELHPVLKSAIVHYEIEIIHPFTDGNGRMGRMWQTLTLAKWNRLFEWIPMETILYRNRSQYYKAIEEAHKDNDSGIFIEFTLSALYEAIEEQRGYQVESRDKNKHNEESGLTQKQITVLRALENKNLSRKEIFDAIKIRGDSRSFKRQIEPLITAGYMEMTIPDKPRSPLQKYRLTEKGKLKLED